MRRLSISLTLVFACGPSAPPTQEPAPQSEEAAPQQPPDAGIPQAVLDAPAWVFRYHTADRTETWTLRYSGADAMMVVESAAGTTRYVGTATDGASLVLDLRATTAAIALDCKRASRAMGTACNDSKAPAVEILDCYHKDFAAPMPFGAAPGIEYVDDDTCNGYRLVAP